MPQDPTDFSTFSAQSAAAGTLDQPKEPTLLEALKARAQPRTLLEELKARALEPTAGERAQGVAGNLAAGAGQVPIGTFLQTPAILGRQIAKAILPDSMQGDMQPEGESILAKLAAGAQRGLQSLIPESVQNEPDGVGRFLTTTLPQGLGSTGGFLASGGATGLLGAAVAGAASNGAAAYHEARSAGASEQTAWTAYLLNSAIGTSEAADLGPILSRLTGHAAGSALKAALLSGSEELVQESVQQALGNVVAQHLYDEDRKTLQDVVGSGGAGFLSGVLYSALASGIGARRAGASASAAHTPAMRQLSVAAGSTESPQEAQSSATSQPISRDLTGSVPPPNAADQALLNSTQLQTPPGNETISPEVLTSGSNLPAQASTSQAVESYGMEHRPPDYGPPAHDLLQGDLAARDIYENPSFYTGFEGPILDATLATLKKARGNPDAEITVYRAAPKKELNRGDWVTLSRKYATNEREEGSSVHSFKVKASDVRWAGDDLAEFGYFPAESAPTSKPSEAVQSAPEAGKAVYVPKTYEHAKDKVVAENMAEREAQGGTPGMAKAVAAQLKSAGLSFKRKGRTGSVYFDVQDSEGDHLATVRVSDHASPSGGGFNEGTGERMGAADLSLDPFSPWRLADVVPALQSGLTEDTFLRQRRRIAETGYGVEPTLLEHLKARSREPAAESSPQVARFLEANQAEGRIVEPATPEQVYASEFLAQRGAKLTLVEGTKPFSMPGMYAKGEVVLDAKRGGELKALAFHEITHRLAAEMPGSWQALFGELATADPEGLKALGNEYRRRLERATGRKLGPEATAEEATAFYSESIPGYLEAAFENPEKLAAIAQSSPRLFRRLADAVVRVLQKIRAGFGLRTSQQRALAALRLELARTPFERSLDPSLAISLSQKIAEAVNQLRTTAVGESQNPTSADTSSPESMGGDQAEPAPQPAPAPPRLTEDSPLEEILAHPDVQGHLQMMASEAGWAEVGGKLIYGSDGYVIGRTKWAPNAEWWPYRPVAMNESRVRKLVAKVIANPEAKLGSAERRMIEWMARQAPPSEPERTSAAFSEDVPFAVAFHGSPYDFDRFDSSRIGSGEGAQAYGHGLYFTEKKEIAEHYRRKLTSSVRSLDELARATYQEGDSPQEATDAFMARTDFSPEERTFLEALQRDGWLGFDYPHQAVPIALSTAHIANYAPSPELKAAVETLRMQRKGKLYSVELAPQEDEYLLWDRPLSEQSEKVKAALEALSGRLVGDGGLDLLRRNSLEDRAPTGQDIVNRIWSVVDAPDTRGRQSQRVSNILHAIGIRGIKYLAGDSRAQTYNVVGYGQAMAGPFPSRRAAEDYIARQNDRANLTIEAIDKPDAAYNYVLFDDKDVTIKEKFAVAGPPGQEGFDTPHEGNAQRLYSAVVHDLQRIENLEKAAPTKLPGESVAQSLSLSPGRRFGEGERLDRQFVRPLKRWLRSSQIPAIESTPEKVSASDFLYALHAPDRNAIIAARSEGFGLESNPGSGMSNSEAAQIVERARQSPQAQTYQNLQDWNRRLVVKRLDILEGSGLLSAEQRAGWEMFGPDFVPLRTAEDPTERLFGGGAGFQVRGKESQRAEGRSSRADSPLIFALARTQEAIERAERNRIGNQIADLALLNPDGPWRVESNANLIRDGEERLSFKKDGEQLYIVTGDKSLADAFKRITHPDPGVIKVLDPLLKWWHQVIIQWNPVFPLTNVPKDIGTAVIKHAITGNGSASVGTLLRALPAAKGAFQAIRSEESKGRWQSVYRTARDAGALIGWSEQFTYQKRVEDFEKATRPTSKAKALGELMEDLNQATELGTRLATFDALLKSGMPEREAAVKTRRITADFARRGRWAPIYRRLYLFSGANIQGTSEMVETIAQNKRRAAVVLGSLIGAGFLNAMLSRMWGDDDELDKLSEFDKARFFGVMIGKRRYGVAAPYGFNVFPYMGWKMAEIMLEGGDKSDALAEIVKASIDSFSPLPAAPTALLAATPTVLRPLAEIATNQDFAGRPITPPANPFDRSPPPNVDQAFQGVSPISKGIAQGLYAGSGEAIDISPEWIDHLAKAATGGLGTFAGRTSEVARKLISGDTEDLRVTDIPVLRPFVQEPGRGAISAKYYDNLRKLNEAQDRQKAGRSLSPEQTRILSLATYSRGAEKRLRALRKQRNTNPEDRTVQKSIDAEMEAFDKQFADTEKAK